MVFDIIFIRNFLVYGSAILFIIFMNVQGYYSIKFNNLLKRKYTKLHKELIWIDLEDKALFIPRPIRLMKYIWMKVLKNVGMNYLKSVLLF